MTALHQVNYTYIFTSYSVLLLPINRSFQLFCLPPSQIPTLLPLTITTCHPFLFPSFPAYAPCLSTILSYYNLLHSSFCNFSFLQPYSSSFPSYLPRSPLVYPARSNHLLFLLRLQQAGGGAAGARRGCVPGLRGFPLPHCTCCQAAEHPTGEYLCQ